MTIPLPLLLLLHLFIMTRLCTGCPLFCTCKWRNGKQTVDCVNRNLAIIPVGIDSASQVLDISGNNFQYLPGEIFLTINLVNIQKLFLARCNIRIIQEDAFKGLTNLVELDLSENYLETVPTSALLNCPSLMKLSLSKNSISSLNRLAFNHLSFLTVLDLSGCEIAEVHEAAFSGLYSLEWIDLSQNQIRSFPDMRLFPSTLKGMQLQENPWTCDCRIKTLNSWLKKDIVPILIPPVCRKPKKFKDLPVRLLEDAQLACTPEVSPNSFYFELEEDKNITLLCKVKSIPSAKISWLFKGRVLHNNTELTPGLHLVYFLEEGEEEKQSNLFIYNLNSEDNGTFYCQAENSAGVSYANYTIMIILTRKPIAIEEKLEFPTEIVSILLAAGLVMLSLCFVALVMTLIKYHTDLKRRKTRPENKDKFISKSKVTVPEQSNLKPPDKQTGIFRRDLDNREITTDSYDVPESNPDIINGIGKDGVSTFGHRTEQKKDLNYLPVINIDSGPIIPMLHKKHPISVTDPALAHRNINRQRTQPYLKPTLTSQSRPVSAPTFERFVENCDVRYTADGYPVQNRINNPVVLVKKASLARGSFSETSTPKQAIKNRVEKLNNLIGEQRQRADEKMIMINPDNVIVH